MLAILAADVVGYARLTEVAEEATHVRLRALRFGVINPCIVSYRGKIVKNTGDGYLASFDSSLDAARCAVALQHEVAAVQSREGHDRKIQFRMGLNVAQTIVESEDIFGKGVNIAARLEQSAPAGGVIISDEMFQEIKDRLEVAVEDLGLLRLKHLSRPVHAYSLLLPEAERLPPSRASRQAKVPFIAVLPFRTQGSPEDDYFGDGTADEIVVALQSIRGLFVISSMSTLPYRTGPVDSQKVGQELGVRYVLSGSIRRADKQLRIGVELKDVEAGIVLWADHYDGDVSELFEFQSRIATRIVWSIAPQVREAELKRALRKRSDNLNAYELLMKAIDFMYRMNFFDFGRAGELLQAAIASDPNYATAYAYAALWHIHNVAQGWGAEGGPDAAESARLAAAAVDRAPADGFALAVLGHTKALLFKDYDAALDLFDRALSASPGNAMAWTLSSGVYGYLEEGRSAITRAEQGLRLSPADTQAYFYLMFLGQAHYISGNFDEAVVWARKTAALNGRLSANLRVLAAAYVASGRGAEARAVAKTLLEIQPRFQLSAYSERCPFREGLRERFIDHLRQAGLPD
ncbi:MULTISPECIES: adenylate/guanylate cyclase domain-containing protein [unclassified Bradyrhizobium]|uniref:adenylate/guanylate cyclase domain-containing protein n=1 Tax=unclassified Bradyrhizobium TaxID=2631580 RepID=UPI00289F109D|nr:MULTISPECIES: adenylate/guanylate cyclase domain-containing protein [unclassified Bradyrhizobium]